MFKKVEFGLNINTTPPDDYHIGRAESHLGTSTNIVRYCTVNGLCRSQLELVLGSGNSCVIKPRQTSTRAQRYMGRELFIFCLGSKALSQISFSI